MISVQYTKLIHIQILHVSTTFTKNIRKINNNRIQHMLWFLQAGYIKKQTGYEVPDQTRYQSLIQNEA